MALPMHETIDGIVIKAVDTGDKKRYLTVLTATMGRITLLANAGHSMHSHQMAVSQLYNYGNFEYYHKGSARILKSGSVIETFYGVSADIDRMNLAAYLCELAWELTDEGEPADQMLRMLLNSLHAIANELRPLDQIKGAFEIRAAAISGYEPDLSGCAECGKSDSEVYFLDVMNGALYCESCRAKRNKTPVSEAYADELREAEILSVLTPSGCAAFRFCVNAPLGRLLSFELRDARELSDFSKAAETYLLSHIGHGFGSLQFYNEMRSIK